MEQAMKEEIAARLNELIGHFQISVNEFANLIGMQRSSSTVYKYFLEEGPSKPSDKVLRRISEAFPSVNMKYITTGEGELIKEVERKVKYNGDEIFEKIEKEASNHTNILIYIEHLKEAYNSIKRERDELEEEVKELLSNYSNVTTEFANFLVEVKRENDKNA